MPEIQESTQPSAYTATQERFPRSSVAPPERSERPDIGGEGKQRRSMEVVGGGSALEAVAGAAAIVLALIGLSTSGSIPYYMMAISALAAGVGLVVHGSSMAATLNDLIAETSDNRSEQADLSTGVTVEVLGGLAGITLAVLALIGLVPNLLLAITVIVFGGALLLSSGAATELNDLRLERANISSRTRTVTRQATIGAAGIQAFAGIAAVVLGILAVTGIEVVMLNLVGFLTVGAALVLTGGVISARMFTFLSRAR